MIVSVHMCSWDTGSHVPTLDLDLVLVYKEWLQLFCGVKKTRCGEGGGADCSLAHSLTLFQTLGTPL